MSRVYCENLLYAVRQNMNFPYSYFLLIILIKVHTESPSKLISDFEECNYEAKICLKYTKRAFKVHINDDFYDQIT